MTSDHLILAGTCGFPLSLMKAADVEAGACIKSVDGEDAVRSIQHC